MQERSLKSFDGTRIVYRVGGTGSRWLVVCNGYGGSFWAWEEIFAALEKRYRLLIWDYRGFYSSGVPDDVQRLTVEDHCADLETLMEQEGIERMALAGWSVGVQVALEHYRRHPESVEALLLINGSHGHVLRRSGDALLSPHLVPAGVRALKRLTPLLAPLLLPPLRAFARTSAAIRLISAAGLVSGQPDAIQTALQSVLTLDFGRYIAMGILADQHDTEDLLPQVSVPTLVTAGDRDIITSTRVARHIADRIPGAIYFEIPGATHYAVMEFPRLLANRIESFLRGQLDHPPV
jgi:pimeloyl-ACP methyl ester carboxylesterase